MLDARPLTPGQVAEGRRFAEFLRKQGEPDIKMEIWLATLAERDKALAEKGEEIERLEQQYADNLGMSVGVENTLLKDDNARITRELEAARAALRSVYDIATKQLAQPESDDTGALILICDAALAPSEKGETG